jgi:hypothetical protein
MLEQLLVSELEEIKDFIGVGYLDLELFNDTFIDLGINVKEIYNEYVFNEFLMYDNKEIASYEDFLKALDLKLNDRGYTEINRYVRFSNNHIFYITDNTLLG